MVFVSYLLLKEANIHINLICFDRSFDHRHINVVTFVPTKQFKKPQFYHKTFIVVKLFNINLLLGLSSPFSQNSRAFLKNCYFFAESLEN